MTEKSVEKEIIINGVFPVTDKLSSLPNREFPGYSRVTIEDITSGRLTSLAKKWYTEHPDFMKEAVTPNNMKNRPCHAKWATDITGNVTIASITEQILYPEYKSRAIYNGHPERIPIKVVSFFPLEGNILLDKTDLSPQMVDFHEYWIVLWAYKNPSGKVTFSQSFISLSTYNYKIANRSDNTKKFVEFMPVPVYAYTERNEGDKKTSEYKLKAPFTLDTILKNHPEISPEPFVKEWAKNGEMPEEMSTKLFGVSESCYAAW